MNENETVSVSKGVFVFKNNFKPPKTTKSKKKTKTEKSKSMFHDNYWYQTYSELLSCLEDDIEDLNSDMFASILRSLIDFIKNTHGSPSEEVPTGVLLTGINMPDHDDQFKALIKQVSQQVSPHVACLYSRDCQNIKNLMENMMNQIINRSEDSSEDESDSEDNGKIRIRKNQMTMSLLQSWYEQLYTMSEDKTENSPSPRKRKFKQKNKIVIVIPDFESFNMQVLQKFIMIISAHIKALPFVFVFGIATSLSMLHTSLPYQATSKINVQAFNSPPSTVYLNNVLERVFFNVTCPFQLGGRVFNLFTDIFLFYDLSVNNFIQNIKYAMAEHFSYGNAMSLCTMDSKTVLQNLNNFTHEDCENARQLLSFRKLVENESFENRIKLLTDDKYFSRVLKENIDTVRKYIRRLHIFVKCLHMLVSDLPGAPLGKQVREIYSFAVSRRITKTKEYRDCFQLLGFQSRNELSSKLLNIVEYMEEFINPTCKKPNKLKDVLNDLKMFHYNINCDDIMECASEEAEKGESVLTKQMDRKKLKEKLMDMTKQNKKPMNKYEKIREKLLEFLKQTFETYLLEPSALYFHEIFFFDDIAIQNNIVGTHRTAIHTALNDPHYYLQCSCCEIPNSSIIRRTMPDICIAYKLHLECGKLINLYDWLQAFLYIVDPVEDDEEDDSQRTVDPKLQARFTQAVTELEYLGFVKSSKRKTDHVSRLTWGG